MVIESILLHEWLAWSLTRRVAVWLCCSMPSIGGASKEVGSKKRMVKPSSHPIASPSSLPDRRPERRKENVKQSKATKVTEISRLF
jgi:hypothetical protein